MRAYIILLQNYAFLDHYALFYKLSKLSCYDSIKFTLKNFEVLITLFIPRSNSKS